jgi:hypothetical protein
MRHGYDERSNGGGYRLEHEGGRMMEDRMMRSRRDRSRDTVGHAQVVKVIELLAESDRSWEDAAQNAVMEASKTIRNIKSVYLKDMQAIVEDGRIVAYRINAKISFALEQHGRFEDTY